jgi:hypothetical protein
MFRLVVYPVLASYSFVYKPMFRENMLPASSIGRYSSSNAKRSGTFLLSSCVKIANITHITHLIILKFSHNQSIFRNVSVVTNVISQGIHLIN